MSSDNAAVKAEKQRPRGPGNVLEVPAIELLKGARDRAVTFSYAGKRWSGLRVCRHAKGEVSKIEVSRFEGVIGDIEAETLEILPTEILSVRKEDV